MCKALISVFRFYRNGFASMTWGRTLWFIILVKLAIMFLILRIFFFQPSLQGNEADKADAVGSRLTNTEQS